MKAPLWKMSWLDRKIRLAKSCVERPVSRESAEQIFVDAQGMFDWAKDRRPFSEAAFLERCKTLLVVVTALKKSLEGKLLSDAAAIEDVLLNLVTARKA